MECARPAAVCRGALEDGRSWKVRVGLWSFGRRVVFAVMVYAELMAQQNAVGRQAFKKGTTPTSAIAQRMLLRSVDVISDDETTFTALDTYATKESMTRAQMLVDDVFQLRNYSVNAPPVEPFASDSEVDSHCKLYEVFCPGPWRIDAGKERRSMFHEAVIDDVKKYGKSSLYCQARCPYSGVTAVHACAINGFLSLLKAFIEFGNCDPLDVAEHLADYFDKKVEKARGADQGGARVRPSRL